MNPSSQFRISVQELVESGGKRTFFTTIDRCDRPLDAMPWDEGRTVAYSSEFRERAVVEAHNWAEFLGVAFDDSVEPRALIPEEYPRLVQQVFNAIDNYVDELTLARPTDAYRAIIRNKVLALASAKPFLAQELQPAAQTA